MTDPTDSRDAVRFIVANLNGAPYPEDAIERLSDPVHARAVVERLVETAATVLTVLCTGLPEGTIEQQLAGILDTQLGIADGTIRPEDLR